MMDSILIYALSVYLTYHLASESDLLARPRAWSIKNMPAWLVYPLGCPLCWTAWISLGLFVMVSETIGLAHLFVAPVINYLIGLAAQCMRRYLGIT